MKRIIYNCRRNHKLSQTVGSVLTIIGLILILKIIPIQFWMLMLGTLCIMAGWFFFRLY